MEQRTNSCLFTCVFVQRIDGIAYDVFDFFFAVENVSMRQMSPKINIINVSMSHKKLFVHRIIYSRRKQIC